MPPLWWISLKISIHPCPPFWPTSGSLAGMMEEVLLSVLGGQSSHRQIVHPLMLMESINDRALHLQANAIEISMVKGYATSAWDYISFCLMFSLPLTPTPQTLARYITYTSKYIASAPKYLTGTQHFLKDIYPEFDTNCAHPLVQSTIHGSKKIHADPICCKQPLCLSHLKAFVHVAHMTHVTNHPHDLRLSLLTYANNPSPMQITLCQPSPQVSSAKHNNPKGIQKHLLFLNSPRLLPSPWTSPLHNNIQLQLQLPDPSSPSLLYSSPRPCILYSFTLYHRYPSKLQITSFMNCINMSCMYCCFLSLILKLFLPYSLTALVSLSAHITTNLPQLQLYHWTWLMLSSPATMILLMLNLAFTSLHIFLCQPYAAHL